MDKKTLEQYPLKSKRTLAKTRVLKIIGILVLISATLLFVNIDSLSIFFFLLFFFVVFLLILRSNTKHNLSNDKRNVAYHMTRTSSPSPSLSEIYFSHHDLNPLIPGSAAWSMRRVLNRVRKTQI